MKAVSSGPTTKTTSSPRTCASREPSARRFPNRMDRVGIDSVPTKESSAATGNKPESSWPCVAGTSPRIAAAAFDSTASNQAWTAPESAGASRGSRIDHDEVLSNSSDTRSPSVILTAVGEKDGGTTWRVRNGARPKRMGSTTSELTEYHRPSSWILAGPTTSNHTGTSSGPLESDSEKRMVCAGASSGGGQDSRRSKWRIHCSTRVLDSRARLGRVVRQSPSFDMDQPVSPRTSI